MLTLSIVSPIEIFDNRGGDCTRKFGFLGGLEFKTKKPYGIQT